MPKTIRLYGGPYDGTTMEAPDDCLAVEIPYLPLRAQYIGPHTDVAEVLPPETWDQWGTVTYVRDYDNVWIPRRAASR